MAGTLVVDTDGRMELHAINSAERTIHCVLRGQPQGIEDTTNHKSEIINHKFLKDGQLLIERNGETYTIEGKKL